MVQRLLTPNFENASFTELETAANCARTQREHNRHRAIMALGVGLDRASCKRRSRSAAVLRAV